MAIFTKQRLACENSRLTSGGFQTPRPMWGGCFRRLSNDGCPYFISDNVLVLILFFNQTRELSMAYIDFPDSYFQQKSRTLLVLSIVFVTEFYWSESLFCWFGQDFHTGNPLKLHSRGFPEVQIFLELIISVTKYLRKCKQSHRRPLVDFDSNFKLRDFHGLRYTQKYISEKSLENEFMWTQGKSKLFTMYL